MKNTFRARYEQENEEAEEIDLGPDFVYPSRRTIRKVFWRARFHQARETREPSPSSMVPLRGYPTFKNNFYELVYVQTSRTDTLHKLMALEYMVPRKNSERVVW